METFVLGNHDILNINKNTMNIGRYTKRNGVKFEGEMKKELENRDIEYNLR